ncbi:type VI secretion system tip protein VgrG [Fibrobacter sp.]|uniref:type VI secretion system tip protein VgrG n=1 Tax=Fibrobacter sp. TaxID=35828 RepID=UPI00386DE752
MSEKSPIFKDEGPLECVIQGNGKALSSVLPIVSVDVYYGINTIPKAVVVIEDGEMNKGKFPLSDGSELEPGSEVTIKAGYAANSSPIFKGVVVRHGVSISKRGRSCVKIECRDKAIAMTCARKNANYLEKTDDAIVKKLAGDYGVSIKSSMGGEAHKEILQYYCTDWDFIMTRAEANGCWLIADDKGMSIEKIAAKGSAEVELTWGTDIIEFKAEANALFQVKNVEAKSWDITKQQVISGKSGMKSLGGQTNLGNSKLQGVLKVSSNTLQSNSQVSKGMLTSWAEAEQLKNELSRICGSVVCLGTTKAKLGGLVGLKNVGDRFKGGALVSGIHHHISDGLWTTEFTFGMSKEWFSEKFEVSSPIASGINCGVHGLMTGVVMQIHEDPEKLNRVKVKIPLMQNEKEDVWARLGGVYASNKFGCMFFPEVGDEVILGFFGGDPSSPVILGSLYSGKHATPQALEQKNNIKQILTREKLSVEFNEEKKSITVMTPGKRKFVLDDDGKKITVEDSSGNKLEMSDSGIKVESKKDITFDTKGKFNVSSVGGIALTSKGDLKGEGLNVEFNGKVGFTGKGSAKAEVSASGQTVIKGAMVMIN